CPRPEIRVERVRRFHAEERLGEDEAPCAASVPRASTDVCLLRHPGAVVPHRPHVGTVTPDFGPAGVWVHPIARLAVHGPSVGVEAPDSETADPASIPAPKRR